MTYRLTTDAGVVREADTAFVPDDPRNRDRAAYQAWVGRGNTPTPAPPAPPREDPPITAPELAQVLVAKGVLSQGDIERAPT